MSPERGDQCFGPSAQTGTDSLDMGVESTGSDAEDKAIFLASCADLD